MTLKLTNKQKNADIIKPEDIAKIFQDILKTEEENDQEKEHFWAIGLTSRKQIKYIELVSLGILNQAIVHARETFRLAIQQNVESIIVAHNHPSKNTEPSPEDIAITRRLVVAGKVLGIEVLDHVIVTKNGYSSLKEKDLL